MPQESIHLVQLLLLGTMYVTCLAVFSVDYFNFISKGSFTRILLKNFRNILIFTISLSFIVFLPIFFQPFNVAISSIAFATILVFLAFIPKLLERYLAYRYIKSSVLKELTLTLDKIKMRCCIYDYPFTGIFYNFLSKSIYVHKKLVELLDVNELLAILLHIQRLYEHWVEQPVRKLTQLVHLAGSIWFLVGTSIVLLISSSSLIHVIFDFLKQPSAKALEALVASLGLYIVASLISLMITYTSWIRVHDADFYAARKVGAKTFIHASIKFSLIAFLNKETKYVELDKLYLIVYSNRIPPLSLRDVFWNLFSRAILLHGFFDLITIILLPLKEEYPPLHFRLRALQTTFRE